MDTNVLSKRIQEDLKNAVKAQDKPLVTTLRMLLNELKNAEKEAREELAQEKEVAVLTSYARRCRESITEFEKGGRADLVAEGRAELDIVMSYLPEQMDEEEIVREARRVVEELSASNMKDMGRVMGEMMKRFKGRADGQTVNRIVAGILKGG